MSQSNTVAMFAEVIDCVHSNRSLRSAVDGDFGSEAVAGVADEMDDFRSVDSLDDDDDDGEATLVMLKGQLKKAN